MQKRADTDGRDEAPGAFGFIILSHRLPDQLLRLVRTISILYDNPPIACHHDFSQSPLDRSAYPSNVQFVMPSIKTGWGKWSVVLATLAALRLLYRIADPDFVLFVTGSDYPTSLAAQTRADLLASGADAFIDGYSLQKALHGDVEDHEPLLANFRSPLNVQLGCARYLRAYVKVPIIRRAPWRLGAQTIPLPFDAPGSPFSDGYDCYFGAQTFTLTRASANRLLLPTKQDRRFGEYLSSRIVPEECYFQTVLKNDASLSVDHRTFRYVNWSRGGAHPKDLDVKDVPHILESRAHFARKFHSNDQALDIIDESLGIRAAS